MFGQDLKKVQRLWEELRGVEDIRRTTVEAIVARLREVGGATAHPESCVGYYRAANIIEREFLNEKGE